MRGTRNTRAAMRQDKGLPGSPSTRVAPSAPNSMGLPGRIATFQKSSVMPAASSAGRTTSRSPTEAPPIVTSTSAPAAPLSFSAIASRVSPAMPKIAALPPARSISAASP